MPSLKPLFSLRERERERERERKTEGEKQSASKEVLLCWFGILYVWLGSLRTAFEHLCTVCAHLFMHLSNAYQVPLCAKPVLCAEGLQEHGKDKSP
jgi:hypothetical protein